ncbi:11953_t:CDS:2, partial [Racocetra persica]
MNKDNQKRQSRPPACQPVKAEVSADSQATIDNRPKNGCRPSNNVFQPCDNVCQPCDQPCKDVCRRDEHVNIQSRQFDNVLCSSTPCSVSPYPGFESLNYDTCGLEQPPPEIFTAPQ